MDPNPPAQPESVGPKDVDVTRLAVLSEHHTRYDQNIEEVRLFHDQMTLNSVP